MAKPSKTGTASAKKISKSTAHHLKINMMPIVKEPKNREEFLQLPIGAKFWSKDDFIYDPPRFYLYKKVHNDPEAGTSGIEPLFVFKVKNGTIKLLNNEENTNT